MTLQTTTWLNLLPFTIGCLLILGFIGYAAYRGQAHIKRFPLHYAGGLPVSYTHLTLPTILLV